MKDITDLFLDTGVGRGAYAIVNQSEIDSILSARAEDRRELFEEAAGIKKYRVKKREAQRKLEHTEQNLVRVRDILGELGSGLAPLEAQATTAKQFQALSERLRSVEVGLLAFDYARLGKSWRIWGGRRTRRWASPTRSRRKPSVWKCPRATWARASPTPKARSTRRGWRSKRRCRKASASRGVSHWGQSGGQARLGSSRRSSGIWQRFRDQCLRFEAEAGERDSGAQTTGERVFGLTRELSAAEATVAESEGALAELTRLVRGQEADYLELARRLAAQTAELIAVRVASPSAGPTSPTPKRARTRALRKPTRRRRKPRRSPKPLQPDAAW